MQSVGEERIADRVQINRGCVLSSLPRRSSTRAPPPLPLPLPESLAWRVSHHRVEGFKHMFYKTLKPLHTCFKSHVWRAAACGRPRRSPLRGGQVAAALLRILTVPAVTVRANPPAAVERPWRFPQQIVSAWRFCVGGQDARQPETAVSGPGRTAGTRSCWLRRAPSAWNRGWLGNRCAVCNGWIRFCMSVDLLAPRCVVCARAHALLCHAKSSTLGHTNTSVLFKLSY